MVRNPDELRGDPGAWSVIDLPTEVAEHVGKTRVDLANPAVRRRVLPILLEVGPPDVVASVLSLPLLRSIWPALPLEDPLRDAWQSCYPALADDVSRALQG